MALTKVRDFSDPAYRWYFGWNQYFDDIVQNESNSKSPGGYLTLRARRTKRYKRVAGRR